MRGVLVVLVVVVVVLVIVFPRESSNAIKNPADRPFGKKALMLVDFYHSGMY